MVKIATEKQIAELANLVRLGRHSRRDLFRIRENAKAQLAQGNSAAQILIDAINQTAVPKLERQYAFLGFCPDGTMDSRLDEFWLKEGLCKFDNIASEPQLKRFSLIHTGDTIILKKVLQLGITIELFAYGEVLEVQDSSLTNLIYFYVDWHSHSEYLIVPALGSRSTVDVRSLDMVESTMPKEFWRWLATGKRVVSKRNQHLEG